MANLVFPPTHTATIRAADADCREALVSIVVPEQVGAAPGKDSRLAVVPCQAEHDPGAPGRVRLTWIARDLKRGESRTVALAPTTPNTPRGVQMRQNGADVDVFVDGKLFTRYDTTTGPNKPYFYPVNAPDGQPVMRHWPVEPNKLAGETTDHPHHRGLWFTHGAVNGVDFWTEGKGTGRTVHTGYQTLTSGWMSGRMVATTDWIDPAGKKIAEDRRDIRVTSLRGGTVMDFEIAIKAVGGPLVWGDTKEGTFALRLADSLRVNLGGGKKGEGHILSATGIKDAATWGKPADWVDCTGPVGGKTVGVAILDHPENPGHPTTWHVRDYGLFAANPFGIHDFDPAQKNNPKAGERVTPAGGTMTFRYRVIVHNGDNSAADIPAVWNAYAHPPTLTAGTASAAKNEGWQPLFDGRSLAGWERKAVHGGNGGIWTVRDGMIVGDQEPDHKGGLLGSLKKWGDCEVELEFQADLPLDSGLFLRTAPDGNAYQVTIDYRGDGTVGSLYVPFGEGAGFVAQDPEWRTKYRGGQWNKLRARIEGQPPRIQVWLNDAPTVDFQDTKQRLPREGYLGLQVHGGNGAWGKDSRIRVRNLRVRPLKSL